MNNKSKIMRILCPLLALIMVLALPGCQPAGNSEGTTPPANTAGSAPTNSPSNGGDSETNAATLEKGQFPLTTEPVTLTIWAKEIVNYEDYATNVSTTEYEKMTGVRIEWDLYSSSMDDNEAFNMLIASGSYPDIISGWFSPERVAMCAEGNVLVPLNDYIESGSYYLDALTEQPHYREMVTANDGNIYNLIYTDSGVHKDSEYKMWVYTQWLEDLNISAPTTPEEFKEMLIAFTQNDMNGNGQNDELPLVGFHNGRQNNPICYLMNPFELYRDNYYYIGDNGEIKFVANTDGWREGLRYINDLFKSGLIMEETYVQDKTQFQALLNRPKGETIVGVFPSWYQGSEVDPTVLDWTDYQAIAPLKGPTGLQQTAARQGGNFNLNSGITSSCKNPEIAFRWLDYMLSDEGNIFTQFGVEGITYDWSDAPGFAGNTPSISMRYFDKPQVWNSGTVPRYDKAEIRYGTTEDETKRNVENTYILFSAAKIYEPYYVWHNVPDIVWCDDNDVITERTDYMALFKEYIDTANTAFVVGTMDINNDADWQNYLDTLNSMGLDDYLNILAEYHK